MTAHDDAPRPDGPEAPAAAGSEVVRLRAEVDRLRDTIGPDEKTYVQLRVDLLAAREYAIGAAAESAEAWARLQASEDLSNRRHEYIERVTADLEEVAGDLAVLRAKAERLDQLRATLPFRIARAIKHPAHVLRRLFGFGA